MALIKEQQGAMINPPDGFDAPLFTWNASQTSQKLQLDQQQLVCTSKQGSGFKTTIGTQIFTPGGKYYYQLFINKGNLLKIGVCRPAPLNLQEAFSDTIHGWGIYNGQTRHNSNSSGPKYGTQLQAGDVIGIALDMVEGTLQYYRNGSSWGVAFKDAELAKGELVAAISPIYINDMVTLKSMIKQD